MKRILLLDDNKELCHLMEQILISFGDVSVSCFHSYDEVARCDLSEAKFDIAFLDVNLGIHSKSGIDVFNWLEAQGYQGKVVFLTGHALSYPLLKKSQENPKVRLLEKPAEIDVIEAIVNE